jgi:hypothetical protein
MYLRLFIAILASLGLDVIVQAKAPAPPSSDYLLLHFSSAQCGACQAMAAQMRDLVDAGWMVREVQPEREPVLVAQWKIAQLPTTIVLCRGQELERLIGPLDHPLFETPAALKPAISPVAHPQIETAFDPMRASVRIGIEDGSTLSYGTGTIIDQHGHEVLVLTCGHLFRDLSPAAQVSVDVPCRGQFMKIVASVVDFHAQDVDIGLLSFKLSEPIDGMAVANLLPRGTKLTENETVCSVGCDHGANPSRRDSHITKINRYLGAPNVEVAKAPVQGRSGGGLFNARGELIGVCYAADTQLDEGLYNGPEVVYAQLERLGLARLYDKPSSKPSVAIQAANANQRPNQSAAVGDTWQKAMAAAALETSQNPSTEPSSPTRLTARIRDARGQEQVIDIVNPPPQLLEALRTESTKARTAFND